MKHKKIALFHNFLDNIGGAEVVTLMMARDLNADIYTTVANRERIKKLGFNPTIYEIGWIPVNAPFRQQLASLRFRFLNLKGKYDFFIIAGDWALSGAVLNKPNMWYCHTPSRELWDLKDYTKKHAVPWWGGWLFEIWTTYNRYLNRRYVQHVTTIVCSSKNAQKRVKNYLHKKSFLLYPPIDTEKFKYKKNGDYWLSVNRLITHKRVDVQLKAFGKMSKERLVVVGSYEKSRHFVRYAEYIKKIKPPNVELIHWVDDTKLRKLYSECRGFITTAFNEDFGLTAVEAMASGKAVIAPNEGGYKETVIDTKTGILLKSVSQDTLIAAVKKVNQNPQKYKEKSLAQAKKFDTKSFLKQLENILEQL